MRLEGIDPIKFLENAKFITGRLDVREVVFSYPIQFKLEGEPAQMFVVNDKGKLLNYGQAPDFIENDENPNESRYLSVMFPGVTFLQPQRGTMGGLLECLVDCRGPMAEKQPSPRPPIGVPTLLPSQEGHDRVLEELLRSAEIGQDTLGSEPVESYLGHDHMNGVKIEVSMQPDDEKGDPAVDDPNDQYIEEQLRAF